MYLHAATIKIVQCKLQLRLTLALAIASYLSIKLQLNYNSACKIAAETDCTYRNCTHIDIPVPIFMHVIFEFCPQWLSIEITPRHTLLLRVYPSI